VASAALNIDMTGPDVRRIMADPEHAAELVAFVLSQPIEVNLEQITIRPAVDLSLI
jgi:NADP-dependent 3-hydroxy acid dehydrogenase YdfG